MAVHYGESEQAVRDTLAALPGNGHVLVQADLADAEAVRRAVDEAAEALGGLDVLVNNVGNYHYGPLADLELDTWHEMFNSNLHATFYLCRAALPLMQRRRRGRIVNLGFTGAETLKARPNIVAYGIAKTGVILYSKALAKTYAGDGITVNVVSPGVMENSVTQPVKAIPLGRTGKLDELADAVLYLVSERAAYVTGVTLEVAGGWNL